MAVTVRANYGYDILRPGAVAMLDIRSGKTYIDESGCDDVMIVEATECGGCGAPHRAIKCPYCGGPNTNLRNPDRCR